MSWLRAALLALLGYWTIRFAVVAQPACPLDLVNLAFHEAGHMFLIPFGETAHFLGGTLGQLAVPTGLSAYFLVQRRQPFAAAVCAWWAGENLVNVSVYMADARTLRLDLVGGGEHDWNTLFYQFGLLGEESVARISGLTHAAGMLLMAAGLAWAVATLLPAPLRERIDRSFGGRSPALRYLLETDQAAARRTPSVQSRRLRRS
jgi:hypothetical protein